MFWSEGKQRERKLKEKEKEKGRGRGRGRGKGEHFLILRLYQLFGLSLHDQNHIKTERNTKEEERKENKNKSEKISYSIPVYQSG